MVKVNLSSSLVRHHAVNVHEEVAVWMEFIGWVSSIYLGAWLLTPGCLPVHLHCIYLFHAFLASASNQGEFFRPQIFHFLSKGHGNPRAALAVLQLTHTSCCCSGHSLNLSVVQHVVYSVYCSKKFPCCSTVSGTWRLNPLKTKRTLTYLIHGAESFLRS